MKPRRSRRPYAINPMERKVHDPWGQKNGNRCGAIINYQYQVAKMETESYYGSTSLNKSIFSMDKSRLFEHNHGRFVRTNRRVEKLRR